MGLSRMPAALRRSFLVVLAVAAVAVSAGLVFAPAASAATGDVTISGRGSGHAQGMSQWGAWVAARDGVSYKKILAFYYPGAKLTSVGDPDQTVKVRITRSANASGAYFRATLKATADSATLVLHAADGDTTKDLAEGDSVTATCVGGKVTVEGITGAFMWIEVRPESTSGRVAASLRATSAGSIYKSEYWGKLRVQAVGTKSLRVFNTLPLERYLRSVAEIDPGWASAGLTEQYAPEAVKAQQVAARTYAVRHKGDAYIYDNTFDQVYLGYTWEAAHPGVKTAVDATAGQVLTRNGAAISALYCASSGGYLSDTAWSNSGSPSYLVAKADPWSLKAPISPWKVNAGLAWTRSFSPETLTAKLKNVANVGTITQVEIVSRDTNDSESHAVKVRITGTTGSKTIAARVFRAKLGLPSTLILTVTMPDAPAAGVTRYQQTDSHLDWAGSWETFKTDGASAGSYKRAGVKGATVTATFKGTYLAWIATKGTTLGKAYVSVDGKTAVKIDLSAAATAYRQNVWDTGTLKSGVHKVKIWWYPSNKAGRFVSIDAFEVKGTLQ